MQLNFKRWHVSAKSPMRLLHLAEVARKFEDYPYVSLYLFDHDGEVHVECYQGSEKVVDTMCSIYDVEAELKRALVPSLDFLEKEFSNYGITVKHENDFAVIRIPVPDSGWTASLRIDYDEIRQMGTAQLRELIVETIKLAREGK